jgi:hypothetical protein
LNLSYKKGSSRPVKVDFELIGIIQRIFALKIYRMIKQNTLLVNIDEVNFSRKTTSSFSWLPKGKK